MSENYTEMGSGKLILIDQTLLPNEIAYRSYDTIEGVYEAIKTIVVREAPAIGLPAAMPWCWQHIRLKTTQGIL